MIKIIDDWYITIEAFPTNYTVRKGKGEKGVRGKWIDKSRGHFTSLRNAVKEIRRQYVAEQLESGERTLDQAISAIVEVDARFEKIMEKIGV